MATRTAEALLLRIDADMGKLRGELTKAERATLSSAQKMRLSLGRVDRAFQGVTRVARRFSGLLAGAAAAGVAMFVKRSIDMADEIAKTADKIGLSTDALQEYTFAADLAGVSQENLHKSLTFFTKTVGEAGLGTGELLTILKDYDKTLLRTVLTTGTVEQKLQEIFRVLGKVENAFTRNALAAKFFGRGGVEMINMVRDGAVALENMRQKARDMGLVLEEDLLRGAEEAKDQLSILARVIEVNLTRAVIKLAPELGRAAEAVANMAAEWAKYKQAAPEREIQKLEKEMARLQERVQTIKEAGAGPIGFIESLIGKEDVRAKRLADVEAEIAALERLIETKRAAATAAAQETGPLRVTIHPLSGGTPFTDTEIKMFERAIKAAERERETALRAREDIHQARLRATGKEIKLIERRRDVSIAALEKLRLREGESAAARVDINIAAEAEIAKVIKRRHKESRQEFEETNEVSLRFVDAFVDRVTDGTLTAGDAFKSFGRTAVGVLQDIANDFLKSGIKNFIRTGTSGLFGSLFAGGGGGSTVGTPISTGTAVAAKGAVFGPGGLTKFGRGGVTTRPAHFAFARGGVGLMGEQGSEAVLPLARLPGGDLGVRATGAGSGEAVTIHQTIAVQAGVAQTVRAEMMNLMPAFRQAAVEAILEAKQSGGHVAEILER